MKKVIVRVIVSLIISTIYSAWIVFLWGSDIVLCDLCIESGFPIHILFAMILFHLLSIFSWMALHRIRIINKCIFDIYTSVISYGILIFTLYCLTDDRFVHGWDWYATLFIASIVPLFVAGYVQIRLLVHLIKLKSKKN